VTAGGARRTVTGTAPESAQVSGAERGEALRSRTFWTMLLGVILADPRYLPSFRTWSRCSPTPD